MKPTTTRGAFLFSTYKRGVLFFLFASLQYAARRARAIVHKVETRSYRKRHMHKQTSVAGAQRPPPMSTRGPTLRSQHALPPPARPPRLRPEIICHEPSSMDDALLPLSASICSSWITTNDKKPMVAHEVIRNRPHQICTKYRPEGYSEVRG